MIFLRPLITLSATIWTLWSLWSSAALGSTTAPPGCLRVPIHQANQQIDSEQRDFLAQRLSPVAGKRALLEAHAELTACGTGASCVELTQFPGHKALRIEWYTANSSSGRLPQPEITSTPASRVLKIPRGTDFVQLPGEGRDLIQHFLMGHPLHPYIALPQERLAVGEAAMVLKPSQKAAIQAASSAIERGDRSFLFVGPTGLGKTEVLTSVLEKQLQRADSRKLHVLIVDQVQLGDQLSESVDALRSKTPFKLIRWGGDQKSGSIVDLARDAKNSDVPTVLVTTIQSLKARVRGSGTDAGAEMNEALLREVLGTLMFDEVHHAGAEQARELITQLINHKDSNAFFYGTTATPMHSEVPLIESLFGNRAFWANLDSAESYLAKSGSVERSMEEVVDQLAISMKKGELAPLGEMHVINPEEFASADDRLFIRGEASEKARYAINPNYYGAVTAELKPFFQEHKKGFVTTSSIEEAQEMEKLFASAVPGKRFAAFHSKMPKEQQTEILNRFKRGEIDFLVTIKKLDEGVNVPDMTLFIDLNRSTGPRQLLQRMGRVLRLFPNKEKADVVTFFEADEHHIREKLILLERILRGDFESPWTASAGEKPNATSVRTQRNRQSLIKIQSKLKEQQAALAANNRWTPVAVAEDLIAFYQTNKRLPVARDKAEIDLYLRLNKMKDNEDFLAEIEEEPALWETVVALAPRKKYNVLGGRGAKPNADLINQFVEETKSKEGTARLPTMRQKNASKEQLAREAALLMRLKKWEGDSEFLSLLTPEAKLLVEERSKAPPPRVGRPPVRIAAEPAPQPLPEPQPEPVAQIPKTVADPTPEAQPVVQPAAQPAVAPTLNRSSAKSRDRKLMREEEIAAAIRAKEARLARERDIQQARVEQTTEALRLSQLKRNLEPNEINALKKSREILRKTGDTAQASAIDQRIGKELQRLKLIKDQQAQLALTPSEATLLRDTVQMTPRGEEDLKGLNPEFQATIRKRALVRIASDPSRAGILNEWGKSNDKAWSYKINFQSNEYRVLYYINGKRVDILMIGKPDEINRHFRARIEQYLKKVP